VLAILPAQSLRAQQADPPENARFVASSRGQVYYFVGCEAWQRLSRTNRIWFATAAEAEEAGYRPSQSRGCAPQLDTALIEPTIGGNAQCVVARIIDGDGFACEGGSRIRLLLVDADEIGQSVYADSAMRLLESLMPPGSPVRLEFDIELHDRYERVLAHVWADTIHINRELVRRGMAHVVVIPPNVRWVEQLRAAADTARRERLGIWSGSAFECTPAQYRAGRCRG
jgi:endonuclease YncB( thermonuclease family)